MHTPEQISKVMNKWIERHYTELAESFLQKGYEKKMYFPQYVNQMFFKTYSEWLEKKNQKQQTIADY